MSDHVVAGANLSEVWARALLKVAGGRRYQGSSQDYRGL